MKTGKVTARASGLIVAAVCASTALQASVTRLPVHGAQPDLPDILTANRIQTTGTTHTTLDAADNQVRQMVMPRSGTWTKDFAADDPLLTADRSAQQLFSADIGLAPADNRGFLPPVAAAAQDTAAQEGGVFSLPALGLLLGFGFVLIAGLRRRYLMQRDFGLPGNKPKIHTQHKSGQTKNGRPLHGL